jgi:hypothetical protein
VHHVRFPSTQQLAGEVRKYNVHELYLLVNHVRFPSIQPQGGPIDIS